MMTKMQIDENIKITREAINLALSPYPNLVITENQGDPVEVSITIAVQSGVARELWIALQNNDELTFSIDRYWYQWFPCTNPKKMKSFVDAISGWLSGKNRILVHSKGNWLVGSEIQAPAEDGWYTLASSWTPCGLMFWKRTTTHEIRNA